MTRQFGQQISHVDQTNDLIPVTLGLMKFLDEVGDSATNSVESAFEAEDPEDELLLAAFLGLFSLRETLRRWIDPVLEDSTKRESRDSLRAPTNIGEILR